MAPAYPPISCPLCRRGHFPRQSYNSRALAACSMCETLAQVDVFPALLTGLAKGRQGKEVFVDSEASCFYHPANKAEIVRESCGRFLCGLCDVDLNGKHYCSACIEAGKDKGKSRNSRRAESSTTARRWFSPSSVCFPSSASPPCR